VPAVEYLRAQRIRYLLIQDTAKVFQNVDVIVAPTQNGSSLTLGNLTGNPCVVVPTKHYQDTTDFHRKHPAL
jgi:hypothetical protein